MSALERTLSKLPTLSDLSRFLPGVSGKAREWELEGFLESQKLAFQGAREVSALLREGWTESQAADLLDTYLQDFGVKAFFHKSFAWFGDRTRFEGIRTYRQFSPAERILREGDVYILDVAPIYRGYICDIGYTASLGENAELTKAKSLLLELREAIPRLFETKKSGAAICKSVDKTIRNQGYTNIHHLYPFSVLGHKVHRGVLEVGGLGALGFGWQSYWELLSRGLFNQLLNENFHGSLNGIWAIEPHVGGQGFGAKFEEILVVENGSARWLDPVGAWE